MASIQKNKVLSMNWIKAYIAIITFLPQTWSKEEQKILRRGNVALTKGSVAGNSLLAKNQEETVSFSSHAAIGSNIFFHEITSATCAFHGFEDILDFSVCYLAAKSYGHNVKENTMGEEVFVGPLDTDRLASGCSIRPRWNFSFYLSKFFSKHNNILSLSQDECAPKSPCFCMTQFFVKHDKENTHNRNEKVNGQFSVEWTLDLAGRENLLEESAFLKAAFEQSVKDYINNDILCSDDLTFKGAEFFGVEISIDNSEEGGKRKAISGNGHCKGDLTKCKKPLKAKNKGKKVGDTYRSPDAFRVVKAIHSGADFCNAFLASTIYDAFEKRLLTASTYNYNVDIGVLNDLEGNLDLQYDVSFEPAKGDGLDQIDDVDMDPKNPVAIDPVCTETQCSTQRDIIRNIFRHFDLEFNEYKHECLIEGINCDNSDLVTHIWMVNYDLDGFTITDSFGDLPSLIGLFLGGNELVGEIPLSFSKLRNLQMLWLENNSLTGTIPTQLGNLRPLIEINFNGNHLEGPIPQEFGKLKNLRMLDLGNNNLHGTIPNFEIQIKATNEPNKGCVLFPDPFSWTKSGFGIFKNVLNLIASSDNDLANMASSNTERIPIHQSKIGDIKEFLDLKTLSLYNNSLTGTIPVELCLMTSLSDFNVAENHLSGSISSEFGELDKLRVLDFHNNTLDGSIPPELGNLNRLEILNFLGNNFANTIPSEIGRLLHLNELILDDNSLIGGIPSEMGNLVNLKYLTFSGNYMSGEIPSELGKLEFLENLDLRGYKAVTKAGAKKISGTIPSELGRLSSWHHVIFQDNGIQGQIPSEFGTLLSAETIWMKNESVSGSISSELSELSLISSMVLGDNSLKGTIPTTIGKLSGMKNFDIGKNSITGQIPTEIGNLASLKFLSLGNNDVTGSLPSELGNLGNLEMLFLDGADLTGEFPTELGNLCCLKALNIGESSFSGTLPTELGLFSGLVNMDFQNSGFTGTIPSEIALIDSLESINLAFNELTSFIPSEIGNMKVLEKINMKHNKMNGSIPSELGKLKNLESLDLTENNFSGKIPKELGNANTLTEILLCANNLEGTIPPALANIDSLIKLELCKNSLTGVIPPSFGTVNKRQAHSVAVVDFGSNNLSGSIPSEFGSIPSLSSLIVSNNQISGTLPSELGNIEGFSILDLSNNVMNGTIPTELGKIRGLTELNLNNNSIHGSLPTELGNINDMESLCIANNELTGTLPSQLENMENLQVLDVGNNQLRGDLPVKLASSSLETLIIVGTNIAGNLWEFCDIRDFQREENLSLDCSDYCGSIEEECTAFNVGAATCADVRCNGGGAPSCTSKCQLDYSSCLPSGDETSFILELQTGDNGWQIDWSIMQGLDIEWKLNKTYRNNAEINEFRCMKRGCYRFVLTDSDEDGICCNSGKGSYAVIVDSVPLENSDQRFQPFIVHHFGICTSSPSTFTSEPSNVFSRLPSQKPSAHPSSHPSYSIAPTVLPSYSPSKTPSNKPSEASTFLPSSYPTLSPSLHPSVLPTFKPSFQPSLYPSMKPSSFPTISPSLYPSMIPTRIPSFQPSLYPSMTSSSFPTITPSLNPSMIPTFIPSYHPSQELSSKPSRKPSFHPSSFPSLKTSSTPSEMPTLTSTSFPSTHPSIGPSYFSSQLPSFQPTLDNVINLSGTGFYTDNEKRNWENCKRAGSNSGYILASIHNGDILPSLTASYWIGAYQIGNNWVWEDASPFDYTNWNPGEPNNWRGIEHHAMILGNHRWNDGSKSNVLRCLWRKK